MSDLQKLFSDELAQIYDIEHQQIDALPKMAEAAESSELREAFETHLDQTKNHVRRVEEVFRSIGEEPSPTSSAAMKALIARSEVMSKRYEENTALDAALIGAAQSIEHVEIASYGSLCAWASELGFDNAVDLLNENLNEEKETDQVLTDLAESRNLEAAHSDTPVKGGVLSTLKKVLS